MQADFLMELLQVLPTNQAETVVTALRHDPLVWGCVGDEEFGKSAVTMAGDNLAMWSPAALALLNINGCGNCQDLASTPMITLPGPILTQVRQVYEETIRLATRPKKLETAMLLALALRERRRMTGSWEGLFAELTSENFGNNDAIVRIWETPLACLFSIVPDPLEMLAHLIQTPLSPISIEWLSHILLSNPLAQDDLLHIFMELQKELPLLSQVDWIKIISEKGRPELACSLAQAIFSRKLSSIATFNGSEISHSDPEKFFATATNLQLLAVLSQLAGQPSYALNLIKILQANLNYWLSGLGIQEVDASVQNGNSGPGFDDLQMSADHLSFSKDLREEYSLLLIKDESRKKLPAQNLSSTQTPIDQIQNALYLWETGEIQQAQGLARSAVLNLMDNSDSILTGKGPSFVISWDPIALVRSLLELELVPEALIIAQKILVRRPADVQLVEQISRIYNQLSDKKNAVEFAQLAVALRPDFLDYHRYLATLWESLSEFQKAIDERRKVARIAESPAVADWFALAEVASVLKNHEEVFDACTRILEFDPGLGKAHALIGKSEIELGNYVDADEHLRLATRLSPGEPFNWLLMARLYKLKGNMQEALTTLRGGMIALPGSVEVALGLAKVCLEMGLFSEGVPLLKQASTMDPVSSDVALDLGKTLLSLNYYEDARIVFSKARNRWTQDPEIAFSYGETLVALGDYKSASESFADAVLPESTDADRYVTYANTLLQEWANENRNDTILAKARAALEKGLIKDSDHFLGRLLMAEVLQVIGENFAAYEIYQKLVDTPESRSVAWRNRIQRGFGKVALALDYVETALAALQEVAVTLPEDIELQQLLAEAFIKADLKQEAIQVARFALKLAPDDLINLAWFVEIMVKLDREREAITALQYATELNPVNPDNWIKIAELQVLTGDKEDLLQTMRSLLALDLLSIDHLRRAAFVFLQMQDNPSALNCLERAAGLSIEPKPDLLFELALLYQNQGDLDNALISMNKAIERAEGNAYLLLMQADLLTLSGQHQDALAVLELAEQHISAYENSSLSQGWVEELTDLLSKEWLQSIHKPTAFDIRYAYLYRSLGDLQNSYKHSLSAMKMDPEDHYLEMVEMMLAEGLLQSTPDDAHLSKTGIEDLSEGDFHSLRIQDQRIICNLIAKNAEAALDRNDDAMCESLVMTGLSLNEGEPRLLALRARQDIRHGEWKGPQDIYSQLKVNIGSPIERRDLESIHEPPMSYLKTELDREQKYWLAELAFDLLQWEDAIQLIEGYCNENPSEPRAWLTLARMLVLMAENQRLFDYLKCIKHAPGASALNVGQIEKFENAISKVSSLTGNIVAQYWALRGNSAFCPNIQNIKSLSNLSPSPNGIAAQIAGLRLINLHSSAVQLADQYPEDPEVLLQAALCYLEVDLPKGFKIAQHAADIKPGSPIHHIVLAMLAEANEQTGITLQSIECALLIWPDEPEWHAWAARIADKLNEDSLVINHLQQAIQLVPENVSYLVALGEKYVSTRAGGKAVDELEKASRLAPDQMQIWLSLAQAYRQAGRIKEAIECSDRAGNLDPKSPLPLLLCGEIALDMKNIDLGFEYAQEAFRRNPQDEKTVIFMSKVLVRQGRLVESLSVIEQSLGTLNTSLPVLVERAKLSRTVHGSKTALPMFRELAGMYPENVEILKWLTKTQIESGDVKNAEQSIREALRLAPADAELNLLMGQMQRGNGQLDQAIHYLSEAIRQSPSQVEPYLELGKAYEERREFLLALRIYQQAIIVAPNDYRPYYLSGLMLRESKDYSGSEAMLRRAADLAPDDVNIRKTLGVVITLNLVHNSLEAKTNL